MYLDDSDDLPADAPEFDFDLLGEVLSTRIQRRRRAAFVLGIHGAWGSGKSTLLGCIRKHIQSTAPNAVIVEFNAWKYQNRESLWRALVLRMVDAVRHAGGDEAKLKELERSLYEGFSVTEQGPLKINWTAAAIEGVQYGLSLASLGLGGAVFGALAQNTRKFFNRAPDGEKAEDTAKRIERMGTVFQRKNTERAIRQVVSIEQFLPLFSELVDSLRDGRRIYVLIDDLDRCLPETALEVFEAIKLFLDSPGCAYVLAVDRGVIRRGLELRYPQPKELRSPPVVDPDEYVEKTITLSIDLPMLSDADARQLLAGSGLAAGVVNSHATAVVGVLGTNPRRIKRFGGALATWLDIAAAQQKKRAALPAGNAAAVVPGPPAPKFSPLSPQDHDLFLKLSLLSYLNSKLFAEMMRDPALPGRLQELSNRAFTVKAAKPALTTLTEGLQQELPSVAQAGLDSAIWRAMQLPPLLNNAPNLDSALRWFRST